MSSATAPRTPSLSGLIRAAIERNLRGLRVCLPARVVSYDSARQTADVQPLIDDTHVGADGTETTEPLPELSDVPVAWPRVGQWFLTMPMQSGDVVLLVFADRSLDDYLASGQSEARDLRSHHLSDAVALPFGPVPFSEALAGAHQEPHAITVGHSQGTQLRVTENTIELGGNAESVSVDSKVQTELRNLRSTLNSVVAAFNSHIHAGTPTTGGPLGPPPPPDPDAPPDAPAPPPGPALVISPPAEVQSTACSSVKLPEGS